MQNCKIYIKKNVYYNCVFIDANLVKKNNFIITYFIYYHKKVQCFAPF